MAYELEDEDMIDFFTKNMNAPEEEEEAGDGWEKDGGHDHSGIVDDYEKSGMEVLQGSGEEGDGESRFCSAQTQLPM